MNELSWLIYLAEVFGNLGVLAAIVMIIAGFTTGLCTILHAVENEAFWVHKPLLLVTAVAALLATVVPSKNTIYAIAASEMGEKALNTPVVNKATKALEAWLDKQIADATSEDDANEDK